MTQAVKKLFVTCSQGLEPLLTEELKEMGYATIREGFRGVHVEVPSIEAIYRINYLSRLGGRVLLPLTDFRCFTQNDLYKAASEIDWAQYIAPGKTFAIDANVNHRKLKNSLYAAQVVKDAICDRLRKERGLRPSIDTKEPDVQLNLFIHQDHAILSFDTSGQPLHKRGYRIETVEAPLQETLAAAVLRIAKYDGEETLYDPCCGSGTFLIEAALIATKTAPGYLRTRWGFSQLPEFSQEEWLKIKTAIDADRVPLRHGKIHGSDKSRNAVRASKLNLRAAGFLQLVDVREADFRDVVPSAIPNLVVVNPPYGRRLEDEEVLVRVYRALGDFMKQKTSKPARGFIFTGSLNLAKEVGLAPKRRYVMNNSGIESRLLEFDLY